MRWAIISGMYNVADLATEFCSYHLGLGVDTIFVADYGSDDDTLERLSPFVRDGRIQLVPLPTHNFATYDPSNAILETIRKKDLADWVSFLDPDEFLVGPENLKEVLAEQYSREVNAVRVPRHNLTGVGPLAADDHYLRHLTLKIVATDVRVIDPAAPLSSPWIFSRLPPKVMIRAQSHLKTTTADHNVVGAKQELKELSPLEILHLPMRGYVAFQTKIERGIGYFAKNPELHPNIGWHWRRWIALFQSGRLREEYERQFPDASESETLLSESRVVWEKRLADWWTNETSRGSYL